MGTTLLSLSLLVILVFAIIFFTKNCWIVVVIILLSFFCSHVVICGGITFETLSTVVRNLIHKDAAVKNIDIVIIDQSVHYSLDK